MKLKEKQLLIIGGSSGIGLETARLPLADGAFVTIAGRSEERLRKAAQNLASDRMRSVVADLIRRIVHSTLFAEVARIDHVFVPAGELQPGGGDALKSDIDVFFSILEVRLLGVAHVVRQAKPIKQYVVAPGRRIAVRSRAQAALGAGARAHRASPGGRVCRDGGDRHGRHGRCCS